MLRYVTEGWRVAWRQPFLLLVLFIYHWLWGFSLLQMAKSVILPLLHRYPGSDLPRQSSDLFWAEGQFALLKTDIAHPYLWLLLGILVLRMILTPLLEAGTFYSLHHSDLNAGYRFVQGARQLGKAYYGYYALQTMLALLPLIWIVPSVQEALHTGSIYRWEWTTPLPWVIGYWAYGYAVRTLFQAMRLNRLTGGGIPGMLQTLLKSCHVLVLSSLIVLTAYLLLFITLTGASLMWAGMTAFVLAQLLHLVHAFGFLWESSSQYRVWMEKIGI
ncbi:hypothetical protein [Paenibacillus sp. y28]|uniref:hypothetical protein n=1 Tax=Paenibacillus sp. y28 TaxID=3129110 RepID=UPI003019A1F8